MAYQPSPSSRLSRNTPASMSSPFATPVVDESVENQIPEPSSVPMTTPSKSDEQPQDPDSDTPAPIPIRPTASNRISQDLGPRSRPGSRMATSTPNGKAPVVNNNASNRWSMDMDAPLNNSASKSAKSARFRPDWDGEPGPSYWYDGPPTMRDYDRYWRGEYYPDRYTARRQYRPPPSSYHNHRRRMTHGGPDSDDEDFPYGDRTSRDLFDTRSRRYPDEEHALPQGRPLLSKPPSLAPGASFQAPFSQAPWSAGNANLDWDNMTSKEKAQVMRLPLTEWMNSSIKNHFVASLGELVGTTMFLFFAFAGTEVANIQSAANDSNTTTGESTGFNVATLLYISLSFGFSLMVNVWVFFRISGGLFNPAVTLGMILVRAISIARGICLFAAQMSGAMLASAIVRYLFPESFNVRTTLGGGASLVQGVFIESILTAELVFTIFMLAKEKHRATFIAPVGIGLALFISELVGVQFTGGSLNPARSFGPCVITGQFDPEHWIYWVGPFVGSILAVLFYRFIKTLEYEMANPGADGDDMNDPTKNPEKMAEITEAKAPSFRS